MKASVAFVTMMAVLASVSSLAQPPDGRMGPGMRMMQGPMRMMAPLASEFPSATNPLTHEKIDLGRMLFFEPRLSIGQTISCNSCHSLDNYGVDGRRVSIGHGNQQGTRNAPSVYNAAAHFAQFWDGRATDVEEQAKGPMLNAVEMAMPSPDYAIRVLKSVPAYVAAFERAFPEDLDPVTFDNLARAIGAFERMLSTPARWDRFLTGDRGAVSMQEMRGWMTFHHAGCTTCHNGSTIGGQSLQKLGAKLPWPRLSDQGRYEVTKLSTDRMIFKVPSLRNVEKTAPYFHDGRIDALPEAVRLMGKHQLGIELEDSEVQSITTWLHTLTGEIPVDFVRPPKLPALTPKQVR